MWFLAKRRGLLKKIAFEKLVVNLPQKLYYVPKGLTAKTVQECERKAYKEFYRHPRFILRQLGEIDSVPEFWRKLKAFFTIQGV